MEDKQKKKKATFLEETKKKDVFEKCQYILLLNKRVYKSEQKKGNIIDSTRIPGSGCFLRVSEKKVDK